MNKGKQREVRHFLTSLKKPFHFFLDGDELYVSNHGFGFGPSPGAGQILRIDTNVKG